jgi:hypothetical protein
VIPNMINSKGDVLINNLTENWLEVSYIVEHAILDGLRNYRILVIISGAG